VCRLRRGGRLPAGAPLEADQQGGGDQHRGVGADQDADQQGEREVGQGVPAEQEQRRQDEQRPEPGVNGAGDGLQACLVDQGAQRLAAALPKPLADAVEDDHRVVDRVADHGQQRGQEHPVQRLAEPGEQPQQDGDVVEHGEDRGRPEGPAEPHRQVSELHQQRDPQGDERLASQLGADGGADELVPQLLDPTADGGDRALDAVLVGPVELAGTDRQVAVPGGLHYGAREAGAGERPAGRVQVDRPLGAVLQQPPAGELHPEGGPADHQPGSGQQQRQQRAGQPPARPADQVGTVGGEPVGQPPAALQAEQGGAPPHPGEPGGQLDQHPGDDQGGEQRHHHPHRQGDAEPADRPGRQEEQQPGGQQGGDAGVGDGAERLGEPRSSAGRRPAPARCSSRIRSNTSTLASTAMPMASTNPAMPGSVRVERSASSTANDSSP
jgi:hypothetical protein